jgi:transposase
MRLWMSPRRPGPYANRQINRVLHIMAVVHLRKPYRGPRLLRPQGRRRKTPVEAMRVLKRRLSNLVYRQMITDACA